MIQWIDVLLLLPVAAGFKKGLKRGPAEEAWKAFNTFGATLLGTGTFLLFQNHFTQWAHSTGLGSITSFLAGFGGSFAILRIVKKKVKQLLETKLKDRARWIGGLLGALRMAAWSLAGLTASILSPISESVEAHSQLAKALASLIGVEN
ncbi:CvpA family protein [Kiritimatiellota bacterium B12222]|nr:CvpA family protein [Kiritimatiellota bacterium B12222]